MLRPRNGTGGLDLAPKNASSPVKDRDPLGGEGIAAGGSGADEVVAVEYPDIAQDPARPRHRFVIIVAPGRYCPGRIDDDGFIEREEEAGEADARDHQGCEDLVRGQP